MIDVGKTWSFNGIDMIVEKDSQDYSKVRMAIQDILDASDTYAYYGGTTNYYRELQAMLFSGYKELMPLIGSGDYPLISDQGAEGDYYITGCKPERVQALNMPKPVYRVILDLLKYPFEMVPWPSKIIAATFGNAGYSTVGQLYKSLDFTGPGGTDPTWELLTSTGLPGTRYIRKFGVDDSDKENDLYVMLSTTSPTTLSDQEVYYSSDGGDNFIKIMDNAIASGAALANKVGKIFGMCVDPENAGTIYVTFKTDGLYGALKESGLLKSVNYGTNWTYTTIILGGYHYRCRSVRAVGNLVGVGGGWGPGGGPAFIVSPDGGTNWEPKKTVGSSVWHPYMQISPAAATFYLNVGGSSMGNDLGYVISPFTSYTVLRDSDNIPPKGKYKMWMSITYADIMRILLSNVMYYTGDTWVTMTTGAAMDWSPDGIAWAGDLSANDDYKRVILFQGTSQGTSDDGDDEEAIFVTNDDGATQENKSGANYKTSPYTNAIPEKAGGICAAAILDRDYYH